MATTDATFFWFAGFPDLAILIHPRLTSPGGLAASTLLVLFLLPALYAAYGRRPADDPVP
jgi:predicted exporter